MEAAEPLAVLLALLPLALGDVIQFPTVRALHEVVGDGEEPGGLGEEGGLEPGCCNC